MQVEQPYFLLLHVEVVNDDTNEEIESEKRSKDDEEDEVKIHRTTILSLRLNKRL